jgi:DNA-binding response OmpR family regulator
MKILIVEDEPKVAAFLKQGLEELDYDVDLVYDGAMGRKFASRNPYDLVLLDIVIPYVNGIALCREIKAARPSLPVLMLTALGTTEDKLSGFDAGADDYLVKPFEFKELLARIKALTRRAGDAPGSPNLLTAGDLKLDLDRKVAERNGRTIELTAREFALLEYFMRNRGRVVSRAEIVEAVWEITFDTGTNVVDVYVNLLRKKIEHDSTGKFIHTRIGMGYMFKEP